MNPSPFDDDGISVAAHERPKRQRNLQCCLTPASSWLVCFCFVGGNCGVLSWFRVWWL